MKFNPGPEDFTHPQFIELKSEIMRLARNFDAKLHIYAILHDIATNADEARRNSINSVCMHFQYVLERENAPGIVLIDRFNDAGNAIDAHLRDKFMIGLTGLPYSAEYRLKNIIGFHYSAIGQSHLPSVLDVALGSLRFAINAHTREQEQHHATARELMTLLSPLFWRAAPDGNIPELGFYFSPKAIRAPKYRTQYESLQNFMAECGVVTMQVITDQRTY